MYTSRLLASDVKYRERANHHNHVLACFASRCAMGMVGTGKAMMMMSNGQ
jgi:hypothetical protein